MTGIQPPEKPAIYQMKIVLLGSEQPEIWRRFTVPNETSLRQLHSVIQAVMGWDNSHMHAFQIKGQRFTGSSGLAELLGGGLEDWVEDDEEEAGNEAEISLGALVPRVKTKFLYEYDFGDSWMHELQVEKILPFEGKKDPLVCLEGEGACPPEDSGGIPGYYSKLDILKDRSDPEYPDVREWMGRFDPNAFSVHKANRKLHHLWELWYGKEQKAKAARQSPSRRKAAQRGRGPRKDRPGERRA